MNIYNILSLLQIFLILILLFESYLLVKIFHIKLRYYTIILNIITNIIIILTLLYITGNYFIYDDLAPKLCSLINYKYICNGLHFYNGDIPMIIYIPFIILPLFKIIWYIWINDNQRIKSIIINLIISYLIIILIIIVTTICMLYDDYYQSIRNLTPAEKQQKVQFDLRG